MCSGPPQQTLARSPANSSRMYEHLEDMKLEISWSRFISDDGNAIHFRKTSWMTVVINGGLNGFDQTAQSQLIAQHYSQRRLSLLLKLVPRLKDTLTYKPFHKS